MVNDEKVVEKPLSSTGDERGVIWRCYTPADIVNVAVNTRNMNAKTCVERLL